MKFLCEQCKAKYQIDDSKVAGKTVRMKCRKCGHLIEVRAEVTETSVASALPKDGSDETKVGAPDPAVLAAQKAAQTPAPKPGVTPPQRPAGQKLATSLASAKPQAQAPRAPQGGTAGSALAGAFQKSVQKSDDALLELSTTAEWYVAINGVPVGPIRLSELRRKAASGAVSEDSLCWQEGLEEWRPLKTFTELASIVREAAATARPSLANPPPDAPHSHTPPPTSAGAPSPSRAPARPAGPATPSPPRSDGKPAPMAARSNVVSLSSRLATAEKLDEVPLEPEEHTVISDPFARIAPEPTPAPPVSAPLATDSSAAALTASAPLGTAMAATASPVTEAAPPKKGPNWIAIAMVVLAAAFGVTAAIAIFFRSNTNNTPQVTTVYVSSTATGPAATATATGTQTAEPVVTASASATGTAVAVAGTGRPPSGAGTAAATATQTATNNSSIAALLGGPATGPNVGGGTGGGTTGGGLSDKAVQDAVRNYTPGVKRTCWERGGSAESTAIVDVTVTVAPNGNVSNATASGNDPLVAKCIENQVRNWRFAAPGETTTIKIPFKFIKQ